MKTIGRALFALLLTSCSIGTPPSLHFESPGRTPLAAPAKDPKLFATPSGALFLLTVGEGGVVQVATAMNDGDSFNPPVRLNAVDTVVASHGENSPEGALGWPYLYVTWEEKAQKGTRLMLGRFNRMSGQAEGATEVVSKAVPSMNGFASVSVAPSGELYVVWLDGSEPVSPGKFAVHLARSTNQGRSFAPPIRVASEACPCCRPAVVGFGGKTYVAWRGADERNVRDILLARSDDSGKSFSPPLKVAPDNWRIEGCPHAGPSLAAEEGSVHVAWRTDAPDGLLSRVRLAKLADGESEFSTPLLLSDGLLDANHPRIALKNGRKWVVFEARKGGFDPLVPFVGEVRDDGSIRLSSPGGDRAEMPSVNYPALVPLESGKVALAWTEEGRVRVVRGRIPGL